MAVRATNLASLDLVDDRRPWKSATDHVRDAPTLASNVIEVENQQIFFTTIDAWMIPQICQYARVSRAPNAALVDRDVGNVPLPIAQIPRLLVDAFAQATPRLRVARSLSASPLAAGIGQSRPARHRRPAGPGTARHPLRGTPA